MANPPISILDFTSVNSASMQSCFGKLFLLPIIVHHWSKTCGPKRWLIAFPKALICILWIWWIHRGDGIRWTELFCLILDILVCCSDKIFFVSFAIILHIMNKPYFLGNLSESRYLLFKCQKKVLNVLDYTWSCLCKPVCSCICLMVYFHAGALRYTLLLELVICLSMHFWLISVFTIYSHVTD